MEEVGEVKEKKGKENRFGRRYGFEIKLRCVKLYLEEGLPLFFVGLILQRPIFERCTFGRKFFLCSEILPPV